MSSGMTVDPDVISKIQTLQMGEKGVKKYRYLKAVIDQDAGRIVVDDFALKGADQLDDYKGLVASLKDDKCAYVFVDMKMAKKEIENDYIFFISWIPDTANVKQRMVYASSKEALVKSAHSVSVKMVQASERSDLDFANLCEVAQK